MFRWCIQLPFILLNQPKSPLIPEEKISPLNSPDTIVSYNIYHRNSFEMMNYRREDRCLHPSAEFSFFDMFDRVLLIRPHR